MKNSFRNFFLIGMIIPVFILLSIIVILTTYKVHDYNKKKSLMEIERLEIERLEIQKIKKKSFKPTIIKPIKQNNDSSLTKITETVVKDINIKQIKTNISDTNKPKKAIVSKPDTINEVIYKPDIINEVIYKPDAIKNID